MNEKNMENIESGSDPSGILRSLDRETKQAERELKEKAEADMKNIRERIEGEVEEYRRAIKEETKKSIEHETDKIKNRALIDTKKKRLEVIEIFIRETIDETVSTVRKEHPDEYGEFLKNAVSESVKRLGGGGITVTVSAEDNGLIDGLKKHCKAAGAASREVAFETSGSIRYGGAIVYDNETGMSCNCTIERLLYRYRDALRKRVYAVIAAANNYYLPGN